MILTYKIGTFEGVKDTFKSPRDRKSKIEFEIALSAIIPDLRKRKVLYQLECNHFSKKKWY